MYSCKSQNSKQMTFFNEKKTFKIYIDDTCESFGVLDPWLPYSNSFPEC